MGAFVLFTWIFNGGAFYGIQKIHPVGGSYKFINPLIAVDRQQVSDFFANQSLQAKLGSVIDKHKNKGEIEQAAVYFRDLEPGRWVGINQDAKFSPGKLLKIPVMLTYFKEAEGNPEILKKHLTYRQTPVNAAHDSRSNLEDGRSYPVEDLIKDMIVNDSDDAADALYDNIDKPALKEVFADLGVEFKEDKQTDDYLSVRLYSLFFRVLYNSTYLNREYSEKALDILSQTPNTDGIATGLPNDLVISNKYRTRNFNKTLQESHDCGIIYYPGHPYLLCVMGIGRNADVINAVFKDLSQAVYKDMTDKYKN